MLVKIEHEYKTEQQVEYLLQDRIQNQIDVHGRILALCTATPKDICPPDQDPYIYIQSTIRDLLDEFSEEVKEAQKLILIRDAWTDNP